jgi:hypothetical protein
LCQAGIGEKQETDRKAEQQEEYAFGTACVIHGQFDCSPSHLTEHALGIIHIVMQNASECNKEYG